MPPPCGASVPSPTCPLAPHSVLHSPSPQIPFSPAPTRRGRCCRLAVTMADDLPEPSEDVEEHRRHLLRLLQPAVRAGRRCFPGSSSSSTFGTAAVTASSSPRPASSLSSELAPGAPHASPASPTRIHSSSKHPPRPNRPSSSTTAAAAIDVDLHHRRLPASPSSSTASPGWWSPGARCHL
ncbi:uncharacterized protein LOC119281300 isoform X1 [Triticum dicoccoides]|uniref:uncharacterized protein LOC119281300 isoform X1 n=1 Tax=Triticum dicoccoides TaxID=85692 RepID=UPI00188F7705|nr:uncharacterized protein LOC119281300 isoform X1 [Triticum dicoccoides]